MWNSITSFASSAAEAAVNAAKQGKAIAETAYSELKNPPAQVRCQQCANMIPVPANSWDWRCSLQECKSLNPRTNTACSVCKTPKPATIPNPTVTCSKCNAQTECPSSGAKSLLTEAKFTVTATAALAKKEFETLTSKPDTFNCEHCNTLLAVPSAIAWNCAQCKSVNAPDSSSCGGCGQKRADDGRLLVMCGACNRPTTVPAIKLLVDIKATVADANRSLFKVYYDVSKTPYVHCPRCNTPCPLPERKSENKVDAKHASVEEKKGLLGGTTDDQKEGIPAPAAEKAGANSAPPPAAPAGASVEVVCGKCSDKLLVQLPN